MIHDPWSMIHDPWSNHPPLPVSGCLWEWVSVTWGRGSSWWSINDGDCRVGDVEEEEEEATTLKVNEWMRERESVSHRVDRWMDGWMDHWWCIIICSISHSGLLDVWWWWWWWWQWYLMYVCVHVLVCVWFSQCGCSRYSSSWSSSWSSLLEAARSFIHSTWCWYHSHPSPIHDPWSMRSMRSMRSMIHDPWSMIHDPWSNHPPLPVCVGV